MIWSIVERAIVVGIGIILVAPARGEMVQKRASKTLVDILSIRQLPGLAALAIYRNDTFLTSVAGVRKVGNTTAITREDKFHLGSNTKAMTATLLAKIIESGNGTLSWSTTLSSTLPNITNLHSGFSNVTLAELASHRSGISSEVHQRDPQFWIALFDPAYDLVKGRKEVTERFLSRPPDLRPNTTYSYSNVNYIILGHIIDNLGIPWEERIRIDLWEPLNMTHCGLGPSPNSSPEAIDNPWPHGSSAAGSVPISPFSLNPPADNPRTIGPAGTAHCSMESYSKFLALHLAGLTGENTTFLSSSALTFLYTPLVQDNVPSYVNIMTPGGWIYIVDSISVSKYGRGAIYHSGSNTLNFALAVVSKEKNAAVAAFTNVGGDDAFRGVEEALDGVFAGNISLGKKEAPTGGPTSGAITGKGGSWWWAAIFIMMASYII